MAEKKSKSDRDIITEAVMAATKKRLDTMSGDEMKASADRMMEVGEEGGYLSRGPHEPWYSEWNPMPPSTVGHDAWARGNWSPYEGIDPKAPPEARTPERAQEYGPWEKGRPWQGGYAEGTGPISPESKGPYPFIGRTLPGEGYLSPEGYHAPSDDWPPDALRRLPAYVDPRFEFPPGPAEEILRHSYSKEQEKLAPIDRAPGPPKQRKSKK
jgi:hypothetical protein